MTKRLIIAFALLLSALMGCEQTVNNVELPYEEKLVVQSMIDTQDSIIKVYVGRTIPPIRDSKMDFWVPDADVFITIDGKEHKLDYHLDTFALPGYNPTPTPFYFIAYKPQENATYSLRVNWKNHTATASTTVPSFDRDTLVFYYDTLTSTIEMTHLRFYLNYTPQSLSYVKYLTTVIYDYHQSISGKELFQIHSGKSKEFSSELYVPKGVVNYRYFIKLAKYDPQYLEYYDSQDNGSLSEDPFSTSGLNREGNINGGIGYFYSRASRNFK